MARKPSERRHGGAEDFGDVNLTPIMSILVILIPMLIFAFSFFEVKIQAVAAPKMGQPKKTDTENEKKPLNLTVLITDDGFKVSQEEELTTEPDAPIPKKLITNDLGMEVKEYDFPTLYNRLMSKKKLHKDERTINIGADPHIPWHVIARTIDASRLQLEETAYDDFEKWSGAKVKKDSDGIPVELFDTVVFTVAE
jgi:biopolymer transport protein ExbD